MNELKRSDVLINTMMILQEKIDELQMKNAELQQGNTELIERVEDWTKEAQNVEKENCLFRDSINALFQQYETCETKKDIDRLMGDFDKALKPTGYDLPF